MADTVRTWSDISERLRDNTTREISPQDLRDALHTFRAYGYMTVVGGTTATEMNASTYTQVNLADFTDQSGAIGVTPDKSNNRLVLGTYGVYAVFAALTVQSSVATTTFYYRLALDGSAVAGGTADTWRVIAASTGMPLCIFTPVIYTSGNGYVTHEALASTGTPSLTIRGGSFGAYRIA